MKFRGLLIGVVVLAALGGVTWWSEREKKDEEAKGGKDAPPKLIAIQDTDVQKVEIKKRGGETLTLVRAEGGGGNWRITTPEETQADTDAVTALVAAFSQLSADRVVDEKPTDLAGYGLNPALYELTLTRKDGKTDKLLVGEETPTAGGSYAMLPGKQQVVTIGAYPKQNLDKGVGDLRDKRILTFNSDKLTGVEVVLPGGKSFAFGKDNSNQWQIVKPGPARADNLQVEELVRKLKDLQMTPQQDPGDANAKSFAAGKPAVTIRVTDAGGAQTVELRKAGDNSFAKASTRPTPLKIDAREVDSLARDVEAYRNRKLFDFGFNDPNRVEVRDGAKHLVFTKSGEKWFLNGKQMDSTGVQNAISKMRELPVAGFTNSGFQSADVELVAVWNDGKKTDRVQLTRLAGGGYIGRREGEPAQYQVEPVPVNELIQAASDVKENQPPPPPPAQKDATKKK